MWPASQSGSLPLAFTFSSLRPPKTSDTTWGIPELEDILTYVRKMLKDVNKSKKIKEKMFYSSFKNTKSDIPSKTLFPYPATLMAKLNLKFNKNMYYLFHWYINKIFI